MVGVGTDDPATDIQVRKAGAAQIRVTSDTDAAIVSVGRVSGAGNGTNAALRYGNNSAGFPYSNSNAVDIINYDIGNVNFYLSASNAGNAQGHFYWHKGANNDRMMTLTNTGRLGIGVTSPQKAVHVSGGSTITGDSFFGADLSVKDDLTVGGTISVGAISANVTGTHTGNVNATSGVSTFFNIKTTDANSNFIGIGIKTDNSSNLGFDFYGNPSNLATRIFFNDDGRVGFGTDDIHENVDINAHTKLATVSAVGVGTTSPSSVVDMRYAGQDFTGDMANRMYMYPPQVNDAQRTNLSGVTSGAVIYNTTANKLQVYVGIGAYNVANWQNCH